MLAWHLATALFLFRWVFRDPKVDVRYLFAGAVLPDVIDLGVVTVAGGDSGQLWAHSLLAPTLVAITVLLTTRRGRRRRAWMALVVAWLLHLLVDGMWTDATVFLWPAFGGQLDIGGDSFWPQSWARATSDPWRWLTEAAGVVYLLWIWRAAGLRDPDARIRLIRTGRLEVTA